MWLYEKKLEYPVNIRKKDLKMAKLLLEQYGGADGEFSAAMRYLNQRYTMPDEKGYALLNDIGTQLMKGATKEELERAGLTPNYVQRDHAIFPTNANGVPFTTAYIDTKGDYRADLESDMAAEQRARATYEYLMDLTNDPDLLSPLSFLRQREVVHYERFKELRDYYLKKYGKNYHAK